MYKIGVSDGVERKSTMRLIRVWRGSDMPEQAETARANSGENYYFLAIVDNDLSESNVGAVFNGVSSSNVLTQCILWAVSVFCSISRVGDLKKVIVSWRN